MNKQLEAITYEIQYKWDCPNCDVVHDATGVPPNEWSETCHNCGAEVVLYSETE